MGLVSGVWCGLAFWGCVLVVRVFDCVGVVCELDSVFVCLFLCLFFVFECFWLGLPALFVWWVFLGFDVLFLFGEFDPGSGRTLAACLTHASRTLKPSLLGG